jgi:hypothetical protein
MANKIFGTDFADDTAPQSTWTISVNNGTALKDVTLGNILKVLAQLTGESSPANADSVLLWDASASEINQVTLSNLFKGMLTDGWLTSEETWTYSSADSPTFIASVNADMTGKISAGFRIKLTQTTAKYFIVTAVGSFSGGVTLITLYGGTDYTLANAAITSPFYSPFKAPLGFPLSPAKWSVSVTDTTQRQQTTPAQNTWYNLGTTTISVPIGSWKVSYRVFAQVVSNAAQTAATCFTTLSTANNSESDADFTGGTQVGGASGTIISGAPVYVEKTLDVAAKTSYFLNTRTTLASMASINNRNDLSKLDLKCVCAYL